MQKLILASQSKQRKAIFETLGLPFEIIPADLDERIITDSDIKIRAEKVARAKAEKITSFHPGIIIAADTFCFVNNKIFEKPESLEEAREMLRESSDNTGLCYTSFCYIDKNNSINFSTALEIPFTFRRLSEKEIDRYIHNNPIMSWSNGVAPAYPEGMALIESINGSLTGFVYGLPMELVVEYLRKSGIKI